MQAGVVSFRCFFGLSYFCLWSGVERLFRMVLVHPNARETGKHLSWGGKDPHCGGQLSHQQGGLLIYLHIQIPEI